MVKLVEQCGAVRTQAPGALLAPSPSEKPEGAARRPLTRERVLCAALDHIDTHGLEDLSMRKLGAALGVEAMSLYHHVPGKGALLDGIVELVLSDLELPGPEVTEWRERLRVGLRSLRRVTLAHPAAIPLIAGREVRTGPALAPVERALATLRSAGFDDTTTVYAFHALVGFVLGGTLQQVHGAFGAPCNPADETARQQQLDAYDQLPSEQFPSVVAVAPRMSSKPCVVPPCSRVFRQAPSRTHKRPKCWG